MIRSRRRESRGYEHPIEIKRQAIELAEKYSVHVAVETLKVPPTSVYRWRRDPSLIN